MIVVTSELWLTELNVSSFAAAVFINRVTIKFKNLTSVVGSNVNCTVLHRQALWFISTRISAVFSFVYVGWYWHQQRGHLSAGGGSV